MKISNSLVSVLIFGLMGVGCATAPPKVNEAMLRPIKKVAISGFSSLNEVPDTLPAGPQMGMTPNLNTFAKQSDTAEAQYNQFAADLRSKMNWEVLSQNHVIQEDAYGDIYLNRMKNWKTKMTPDRSYQIHFVKNVLPYDESSAFTPQVRDHVMTTLNVDALIDVQFKNSMKKTWSIGSLGNTYGQSVATVRVYRKGVAEPIWEDNYAEGVQTTESLSFQLGGYDMSQEPELFKIYKQSTKLSTVALFNRKDVNEKQD